MRVTDIDEKTAALIGFALKSGQFVSGFEAVIQAVEKDKIAVILLNGGISENTEKKLSRSLQEQNIKLVKTGAGTDWQQLWGIHGPKILGIKSGALGRKIMMNLKVGV